MTPYNSELFHSIYDGWLLFVSIAMIVIVIVFLAFPTYASNSRPLKGLLIVGTLLQLAGWWFIRYGFIYEPELSYRDISAAQPAALFFTLFGLTAIFVLVLRLPQRLHRLALVAFVAVIVLGLLPFIAVLSGSVISVISVVTLAILIFTLLLLYLTGAQRHLHILLRVLLTAVVWMGSSAALLLWLVAPGLG